jgi:hypothetical protein
MKFRKIPFALGALALSQALPLGSQTASVTIEAESMTRSSYSVSGNLIQVSSLSATGTATQAFAGPSGTYNVQVHVMQENDGRPTLELHKGATRLHTYTYPSGTTMTSFTVNNVALNNGEVIKLVGRPNGYAYARVDKIVLTPVASATPTPSTGTPTSPIVGDGVGSVSPLTIDAKSMALSSYAPEGNLIKLVASTGSATKGFAGASGTYNMQVHVLPENDGRPTLELYKGASRLSSYTYPLGTSLTSFTVNNVALKQGETLKLVGRANGGAWARVEKIVLTPSSGTPSSEPVPSSPSPTPSGSACANPSGGYEGFGRNTTGGAGKPVYRVTNLSDSGTGSLRDALSQGNRCVLFDVAGTISLGSDLLVKGANVTIDGFSAPSPGITLKNRTLIMQGASGAGNVVVRGIRHRGASNDALRVYGASNIVIDHVSISGFGDGGLDITERSRDVSVQWSIFGSGASSLNASLIKYETSRVSVHHNLYINNNDRHPHCGRSDTASSQMSEIVCDVRNNVIWNYRYYGTRIRTYATANVVNNYFYTTSGAGAANTIYQDAGTGAHVSGNHSANGWNLNGLGNRSTPYAAIAPATTDAITAARQVLASAGARGPKFALDSADQGYINQVSIQSQ